MIEKIVSLGLRKRWLMVASFVFVEISPWLFQRRRITPGAQIERLTAIADGLKAGERLVVENAVLLQ